MKLIIGLIIGVLIGVGGTLLLHKEAKAAQCRVPMTLEACAQLQNWR